MDIPRTGSKSALRRRIRVYGILFGVSEKMSHAELLLVGKPPPPKGGNFLRNKPEGHLSLRLHVWLVWI